MSKADLVRLRQEYVTFCVFKARELPLEERWPYIEAGLKFAESPEFAETIERQDAIRAEWEEAP